jgi:hypothetical protein
MLCQERMSVIGNATSPVLEELFAASFSWWLLLQKTCFFQPALADFLQRSPAKAGLQDFIGGTLTTS